MNRRKLNLIVGYVSRSLSAAALMIWGVVNVSALLIQQLRSQVPDGNWTTSWIMCGLFGFLPFMMGAWLLYRNVVTAANVGKLEK
jgi:hypothetical protein